MLTNTNAQLQTPLSKGPETMTSTPAEQRNGSPDISDAKASPRKCLAAPSETIAPVAEEVLSEGEDDVFDGKEKVEKQGMDILVNENLNVQTCTLQCSSVLFFFIMAVIILQIMACKHFMHYGF